MLQLIDFLARHPAYCVAGVIALAVLARLAAGRLDRMRILGHFEGSGRRVVACRWVPFGPGWYGNLYSRIYRVEWMERGGEAGTAFVKTSMLGGVYVTPGGIAHAGGRRKRTLLKQENALLRARVDELEEQLRERR
ncbi:MAG: hypothetical protein AAFU73_17680 [Planctomycetota bacterium]